MSDPDVIYLLQPCSDAGYGRLWCQDALTCDEASDGPHFDCKHCGGEGLPPTRYVRADRLAALEREHEQLRDGIRALAESCDQRAQLAEYDAESASQCNDLWRGRAQEGKRVAARLRALLGEKR